MKKLLLLLLIAPMFGFGQVLTDVFYVWQNFNQNSSKRNAVDLNYTENHTQYFFTVPEGKFWVIMEKHTFGVYSEALYSNGFWRAYDGSSTNSEYVCRIFVKEDNAINPPPKQKHIYSSTSSPYLLPNVYIQLGHTRIYEGTTFFLDAFETSSSNKFSKYLIYEYSLDNNSLSYNEPETIKNNSNTPVLFPNPTSSLLALNSDKDYDIEVYDMAGNKVMALTGNTIDMSHLSSATYIVKALDKVENEEVSYKVVKY